MQSRDFTYVGTVAHVLAGAAVCKVTFDGLVDLAFGSRRTLLGAVAMLENIFTEGFSSTTANVDQAMLFNCQADARKLKELFPDMTPVGFNEGLERTV